MSKLFSIYLKEKEKNNNDIILFKSGIFFIALAEDATFLSSNLGLKLTKLNDKVQKCGFPISSSEKYFKILKHITHFIIIDISYYSTYSYNNYFKDKKTIKLLTDISNIDIDNISISEAYKKLEEFKNKSKDILKI